MPNALENLLINKYGVAPEDATAYATQIIASTQGDSHGAALKEEALSNVATNELGTMQSLGRFPQAVSAAQGGNTMGLSPQDLDFAIGLLDKSRQNTVDNAAKAGDFVRNSQAKTAAGMAEQTADNIRYAGAINRPGQVEEIPVLPKTLEVPVQPQEQPQPSPHPYEAKLQRVMALRKSVLGF